MPPKSRRSVAHPSINSEQKREDIISAAQALFARKTFSGTSIRDIARKMILEQPNLQALLRNNQYEPYIQVDIVPFFRKT